MIRRNFVTIGERQVHYRCAGSGPPVILLHQSPRDSEEMAPVMRALAARFTVIAPDTPGYGQSDAIAAADGDPDIDVFVNGLAALMDALGIARAGVYGTHTGAIIATRFAARRPDRVAALVANGVLLMTSAERSSMLAQYLPSLHPTWDGSHLAWVWNRLRDQSIFYPWYDRDPAHRIHWATTLPELDAAALDLLEAGDDYRTAYRAAIGYAIEDDLPRLTTPTCFLFAGTDALAKHADAFPTLPPGVELQRIADFDEAPAAAEAFLAAHLAAAPAPVPPEPLGLAHRATSRMAPVSGGDLHLRASLSGAGRPILLLHDLGDSSAVLRPVIASLVGARPVIAPDLTGHGESLPFSVGASLQAAADHLVEAIDHLNLESFDIAAFGASGAIAARVARALPHRIGRVLTCNARQSPPGLSARALAPDLTPETSGAHLHRAWTYVRDRDLYSPWFDPVAGQHLAGATPARLYALQDRLLACLKARACYADLLEEAMAEAAPREDLSLAGDPAGWGWRIAAAFTAAG
jgi:haloalkane dehalogenase